MNADAPPDGLLHHSGRIPAVALIASVLRCLAPHDLIEARPGRGKGGARVAKPPDQPVQASVSNARE